MLITSEDAYPAFLEVQRVRETLARYSLAGAVIPASLDDIEQAICEEYDAIVEKKVLPFKSDLVRGLIRIWGPRDNRKLFAQTVIDSELNLGQSRYVQAKELCHVMLFHKESCTLDPTQIIAHFVQESVVVANSNVLDLKNETLADVCAFELLFPHDLRAAAAERIAAKHDTNFSIADWLEIPEHVVEQILEAGYMEFANEVWALVNDRGSVAA